MKKHQRGAAVGHFAQRVVERGDSGPRLVQYLEASGELAFKERNCEHQLKHTGATG
jgi:hypothetical protein